MQDRIRVAGTILNDWRMESGQSREYRTQYQRYQRPAGQSA
jgi:hypothetical protein